MDSQQKNKVVGVNNVKNCGDCPWDWSDRKTLLGRPSCMANQKTRVRVGCLVLEGIERVSEPITLKDRFKMGDAEIDPALLDQLEKHNEDEFFRGTALALQASDMLRIQGATE